MTAPIGGILDANGAGMNITARDLALVLCDNAGSSSDFLEVSVSTLDATVLGAPGTVLFRNRVQGLGTGDQTAAVRTDPAQALATIVRGSYASATGQASSADGSRAKTSDLFDASAVGETND